MYGWCFCCVMPGLLTHCARCPPLTSGLKQFYTRSVTAELADGYLKRFSKLIKKIKITLSLRCLTWFVCSHRTPQSGLCYCQEQTPCVVYSWFTSNSFTSFKTQSFFTSSLKFQVSTVSADFSFIIILLPLLYFFYLHCEIWNLKAKS